MNREQFEGNWHLLKGKIKEKWGKLTDDDITRINGKYEQFVGTLQKKYGYSREQAERESNTWNHENRNEGYSGGNEYRNQPRHENKGNFGNGPKEHSSNSGCGCKGKKQEKDKFKDNDQRDKKRKAG